MCILTVPVFMNNNIELHLIIYDIIILYIKLIMTLIYLI